LIKRLSTVFRWLDVLFFHPSCSAAFHGGVSGISQGWGDFNVLSTVYGSEQVYSRLVEPERYRFQLSRSAPSSSWRHEREWRLRGDLPTDEISLGSRVSSRGPAGQKSNSQARLAGFVFVQTEEEKEKLLSHVNPDMPIIVLNDCFLSGE
jgi:hypothetical protein